MLVAGEEQRGPSTPGVPRTSARKEKESKGKHQELNHDSGSAFVASKAHQCSECDERFGSLLEAQVHRQQVHTGAATWHPQHRCPACDQTFSEKRSLYVHGVVQHGAPHRHQCDQCDYEGARLYHLKRHMKVHTGERNHVCEICHKGLKSLQAYKNHMVLHTNKGRYRCDQCQKAFNQRSLYEDHCRSHRAARCYSCKYCDATFKTYKNVACHVRAVHLGDKRFICDVCGTQHMTGANLRAHLKIHRNAASMPHAFHCDVCETSFRGLRGLTVHLEVVHGVAKDLEEAGQGATTQHPTRRPQRIDYTVVGDRGGSASGGGEDADTLTHKSIVGGSTHGEEEQEDDIENMERNEREIIAEADSEEEPEEEKEEEMQETEATVMTEEQLSEEADGSTVIVESDNLVFRVKAEDIEFDL